MCFLEKKCKFYVEFLFYYLKVNKNLTTLNLLSVECNFVIMCTNKQMGFTVQLLSNYTSIDKFMYVKNK